MTDNVIDLFSGAISTNDHRGRLILNNDIDGKPFIEVEGIIATDRAVFMLEHAKKLILDGAE